MEPQKEKFNWKRLLITITFVILGAGAIGGTTWYLMDQNSKKERDSFEKQIRELEKQRDQKESANAKEEDETADWKTYTSAKYGFTIKYPKTWTYQENAPTGSGNQYWGGNVFSANNVIFKNDASQTGIGLNMEDILGRGGTCVKRNIFYKPSVASKKLVITKSSDTTEETASSENMMCQGALTGFVAGVEQFTQGGIEYFLHSESAAVTDAVATQTIAVFEKMMATMTFK